MTNDINAPRYKELLRLRAFGDRAIAYAYESFNKDEIVAELEGNSDEDLKRLYDEIIFKKGESE